MSISMWLLGLYNLDIVISFIIYRAHTLKNELWNKSIIDKNVLSKYGLALGL